MAMPAMFKRESLTRLAQGAAVGAVATMIMASTGVDGCRENR